MSTTTYQCYLKVMRREILRIATKPMYLFCMVIAPLFCFLFFTTLMENGLPTNLPAGVVDLDNTATTRNIIRNLDAFQQTQIVAHYPSVTEARQAVQRGEIYSFYYIPKGTTEEALASRQRGTSNPISQRSHRRPGTCLPATGSHFYPCTEQPLAELLGVLV